MAKKLQCGIITFHRAHNYGALLQAYALRKIIASLGYDVKFIDYQHKNLEEGYNLYPKLPSNITTGKFIRYSKDWAHLVLDYRRKKARNIAFNDFINTYIPLIPIERDVSLDVIVLGSDQIWNSKYTSGLDENYYGINKKINSNIKISYAASMGLSSLDKKDEISTEPPCEPIEFTDKMFN